MAVELSKPTVLAVVGPTSAGKSALAARLATGLDGEVVGADSRQVYRYMDIGTAKPTSEQRAAVPHHLIDIADPDQPFSLALFLRRARAAIEEIQARGKLPIVAGGTGQYVWGLLEGWQVPEVPPDSELRRKLEERARMEGTEALYMELAGVDPVAAERVDRRNVRRVIRALEVYHSTDGGNVGRPARRETTFHSVIFGLTLPQPMLAERIHGRVDAMIEAGWVGEVQDLLSRGYHIDLPSMSSLGYRELAGHLSGQLSLGEAVDSIKRGTVRFARQQHAWFRTEDPRIRWSQGTGEGMDEVVANATECLKGRPT